MYLYHYNQGLTYDILRMLAIEGQWGKIWKMDVEGVISHGLMERLTSEFREEWDKFCGMTYNDFRESEYADPFPLAKKLVVIRKRNYKYILRSKR